MTANSVHVVLAHLRHRLNNNENNSPDTEDVSTTEGIFITSDSNKSNNNLETLAVKITTEALGSRVFEGACVDSGAQQSAI